ncbi:restriction endonuclease subunit S [Helicobacter sp. MIT 99-5507]|uniref:restriction endonuclease subunit S n=1 Tax=Helicobacter sp. MIT 99-5507 TaxID=152489 RepID=UPI0015F19151|nr:restriction endonuclease subunit S [Helicobacter sp. MIT 99-5507]
MMNNLPQGWEVKTLGEVCEIYTGNSINQAKKEKEFTNLKEGLNYIATKDIGFDNVINYNNGVKIPFEKVKDFKTAKVNSSLLCIEGGSAGRKIGFTNQKVCFVNKLCCFETLQDEPRFIYYYLQSDYFMQKFRLNMSGLIGGVSKDRIKQIQIPLPPLEVQKAIVEKLENAFAHIDEAVRHLKAVQTNIPRLKSSLLHSAFSGKLTESQITTPISMLSFSQRKSNPSPLPLTKEMLPFFCTKGEPAHSPLLAKNRA